MTRNYDVGYGKPPKHAQWKKGQSGNPEGGRRRPTDVAALTAQLLSKRVVVRSGKTTKRVTRLEQILSRLIEKALQGDPRTLKMVLDEMRKVDARAENDAPAPLEAADLEVIEAARRR